MGADARLTIDVDAPIGLVWEVLTDLERYGEWNPMTPRVEGRLAEGETLRLTARVGRWMRVQQQAVYELVPERRLVWSGAFGGELVRGVRTQTLEDLGNGRTRYATQDVFSGPLARLTERLYGETLHAGFQAMAEALKDRCEAWAGSTPAGTTVTVPADLEQRRLPQRASWYHVARTDDLAPGAVRQVQLCGQDVVVWRTTGGRLGAARNVCGHMASRLSPGAHVRGETLVCPHHGMGFRVNGAACAREAHDLRTLPIREVGPVVMVWFHPDGARPSFELPDLATDGWSRWRFRHIDLPVHPQHIMEDLADARHFLSVHGYRSLRAVRPCAAEGATLSFTGEVGWDPGLGMLPSLPLTFTTTATGMGFQTTDVQMPGGVALSRHLVLPTPLDDDHTRVTLGVATRWNTPGPAWLTRVARRLAREAAFGAFVRDVHRDARLWTQRHHHAEHLPPGDAAHAVFQSWIAQFAMMARQEAA